MVGKLVAFVLMGLGAFIVFGLLVATIPSLQHTAFVVGGHAISWLKLAGAGLIGTVLYIASKVKT